MIRGIVDDSLPFPRIRPILQSINAIGTRMPAHTCPASTWEA